MTNHPCRAAANRAFPRWQTKKRSRRSRSASRQKPEVRYNALMLVPVLPRLVFSFSMAGSVQRSSLLSGHALLAAIDGPI